jgi:microcystin-dependent protein
MACTDCLKNCPQIVSDKCVETTIASDSYPLLGICQGDSLFQVETIILDKLTAITDGTGIVLSEITLDNCQFLLDILGTKDKTLFNLVQMLVDASCSLKTMVDALKETPYSFNTACLTGLPANPTSNDVLQAALNKLCSLSSTVDAFPSTFVKQSDLENLVLQIIGEQTEAIIQYANRLIPFVASPYFGSLSNFDITGKGITTLGFDKIYLCNGLNGTPDLRGRSVVGAVNGVPGGVMDAAINPSNPDNSLQNVNYAINEKFGKNFHKLSVAEAPSHGHGVFDPGHIHPTGQFFARPINYGNENSIPVLQKNSGAHSELITPQTNNQNTKTITGIIVEPTGGDVAHENRQPSIAAYWIIHIP